MTIPSRRLRWRGLAVAGLICAVVASCANTDSGLDVPTLPAQETSATGDLTTVPPGPVDLPRIGVDPAVIQVCLDTGSTALAARPDLVQVTVAAIVAALRGKSPGLQEVGGVVGPYRRGLVVQLWSTETDAPPLFTAEIPGPDPIAFQTLDDSTGPTLSPQQLIDFEDRQDFQFDQVMPQIDADFDAMLLSLGQVQAQPAQRSDLGACVGRANVAATQWAGQHRLLIVASDFPLPPPVQGNGTWETTRVAMLLGVSANAPERFVQWAPVWESWGLETGVRRFEAQLDDGLSLRLETYVLKVLE